MEWPKRDDKSTKISNTPNYASSNWRSLAPVIEQEKDILWVGSGVPVQQHPAHNYKHLDASCASCKAADTTCIYFSVNVDLVEKTYTYELWCQSCGSFTSYLYWS